MKREGSKYLQIEENLENELDFSSNGLKSIPRIISDQSKNFYTKLDLSSNHLENLKNLSQFKNLRQLNISNNLIESFSQLYALNNNKNLKSLSIRNNPICEVENFKEILIQLLPNLSALNGLPITQNERENSNSFCRRNFSLLPYLYQNMVIIVICVKLKKLIFMHEELKEAYPSFFLKNENYSEFRSEIFFREMTKSTNCEKGELSVPFITDLLDDIELIVEEIDEEDEFRYDKAIMDLMQRQLKKIEDVKEEITNLAEIRNQRIDDDIETPRIIEIKFENPDMNKSPEFGISKTVRSHVGNSSLGDVRNQVFNEDSKSVITELNQKRESNFSHNRSFSYKNIGGKKSKRKMLRNSSYYGSNSKRENFMESEISFNYNFSQGSKLNFPLEKAQRKLKQATELYLQKEKEFTYMRKQLEKVKKNLKSEDQKIQNFKFRMREFEELEHTRISLEEVIDDRLVELKKIENKKKILIQEAEEFEQMIQVKEDFKGVIKGQLAVEANMEIGVEFRNYWLKKNFFIWVKKHDEIKQKITYIKWLRNMRLKKNFMKKWWNIKLDKERLEQVARRSEIDIESIKNLTSEGLILELKKELESRKSPRMLFICFFKLKENLKIVKELRHMREIAEEYSDFRGLRKIFNTLKIHWKRNRRNSETENMILKTAKRHMKRYKLRVMMHLWRNFAKPISQNLIPFEKISDFKKKYSRQKIFKILKRNSLLIDDTFMEIREKNRENLKKKYFKIWIEEQIPIHRKLKYWRRRVKYSMKKKVLKYWKMEIETEKFLKKREIFFSSKNNYRKIKLCFKALRINRNENLRHRKNFEKAEKFCEERMKKKYLKIFFKRFQYGKRLLNLRKIRENREMRLRLDEMRRYEDIKLKNFELKENLNFFKSKAKISRKKFLLKIWSKAAQIAKMERLRIEGFQLRGNYRLKKKAFKILQKNILKNLFKKQSSFNKKAVFKAEFGKQINESLMKKSTHLFHNREIINGLKSRLKNISRKNELLQENESLNKKKIDEERLKQEEIFLKKKKLEKDKSEQSEEIIEEMEDNRYKVQKLETEIEEIKNSVSAYRNDIKKTREFISNAKENFGMVMNKTDVKNFGFESDKKKLGLRLNEVELDIEGIKELLDTLTFEIEKKREELLCLKKHNVKLKIKNKETKDLIFDKNENETENYLERQIELAKVKDELINSCNVIKRGIYNSHVKKYSFENQRKSLSERIFKIEKSSKLKKMQEKSMGTIKTYRKVPNLSITKSQPSVSERIPGFVNLESEISGLSETKVIPSKLSSSSSGVLPGGKVFVDGVSGKKFDSRSIQERMRMLQLCMDHDLSSFN